LGHLEVVDHTSLRLVNLVQDETGVACWGRVEIHGVGRLRCLGQVVTQKSLVSLAVMRGLHPSTVTTKDAIALLYLIRWSNEE
jgi:hypothetical protein